jgi:DNA polymerase I-like protein with 3'-5' exonuclease and polymerase domains
VEREAKNFPMQGACADGFKLAMALFNEGLPEHLYAKLILTVHDELVVECREGQADEVKHSASGLIMAVSAPGRLQMLASLVPMLHAGADTSWCP